MQNFRDRCVELGMPLTHQRLVIYEALASTDEHPTPEAVFERVRKKIPSISLATVYKNIRSFADAGLLREVSLLHESLRLDANLADHHHLVCERCKSVTDLPHDALAPVRMKINPPDRFQVHRFNVEVLGLCARCAATDS
ncbi:MAG: transcriptional repressor [Acidobacteria bacterium]|nr:transcriptional repressor [Acidobacteriota bacterium]